LGPSPAKTSTGIAHEVDEDSRYFLWSTVVLEEATDIEFCVSTPAPAGRNVGPVNAPAEVFIDGQRVDDLSQIVALDAGRHTILLHYENGGESHVVLRRADVAKPPQEVPLAMSWFDDPGVLHYDPFVGDRPVEWFRFLSAPGTTSITVPAASREPVRAWIDGREMIDRGDGRFDAPEPVPHAATVALRICPPSGWCGGAALRDAVKVETTGEGVMAPGDWSKLGILSNYSGGVRYRTTFTLSEDEAGGTVELGLGRVIATAEVSVNGAGAGVRVAPPWKVDLTGKAKAGENALEVLVYNTLANHYQTIPSQYRGDPESGLLGPVTLRIRL
jgi:hypothetical protein